MKHIVPRPKLEVFAKHLHRLMTRKNLSQSDLAREVWGSTTDSRGYDVARNRDRISVYLKGGAFPDRKNLQKLAKALDVTVEELSRPVTRIAFQNQIPQDQKNSCDVALVVFASLAARDEEIARLKEALREIACRPDLTPCTCFDETGCSYGIARAALNGDDE